MVLLVLLAPGAPILFLTNSLHFAAVFVFLFWIGVIAYAANASTQMPTKRKPVMWLRLPDPPPAVSTKRVPESKPKKGAKSDDPFRDF